MFFDAISKFFGFDRDPAGGKWPRRVATSELPPERIPIVGYSRPLRLGIREVTGPDHQGWQGWSPQRRQDNGIKEFTRYLQDGALPPPQQK
jgi:hypothetical protein